ncbi:MAG: DUF1003 domain-containing protein [Patescibacteria group bacterium]|nr:DUF1003 domain-containing protein [Patescibacteria group bacterium]
MDINPRHRLHNTAMAVTRWVGSPQSIIIHTILFITAILVLIKGVFSFDVVILVLNTAVSLEAIYLALFIQMTVNYQRESLEEVEQDIDEIQGDIDEIQEDVGELAEDVEEMSEEEKEDEAHKSQQKATLDQIHTGLQKLIQDVERLQQKQNI